MAEIEATIMLSATAAKAEHDPSALAAEQLTSVYASSQRDDAQCLQAPISDMQDPAAVLKPGASFPSSGRA